MTDNSMSIVRALDAPRFELPGLRFTGLAAPSRGSAQLCTWRLTVEPGQGPGEPHTLDRDEVFMVLSGRLRLGDGTELGPGDAWTAQAGQPIAVGNPYDQPAEVYVAIPAGFTASLADGSRMTPPWAV